jgi:ABC-type nitrate/sulfonate/bicarbonate transport system substrate-binding protein
MAATPDFIDKNPDAIVAYLKAWLDAKHDFKENPKKVADVIYSFFASKGYKMSRDTFQTAMGRVEVDPGFPHDLVPYLTHHAEVLLKEKKIANQTGSSIGNIFVDQVGPANGLKKGDFQEVRMNVNDMMAAMSSKTVDAMINVEPYNAIAEAEGIGTIIMNLSKYDKVPVFMAATPDFVEKNPDAIVAYLKAWLDVKKDIQSNPQKVADVIHSFFTSKGYKMDPKTFNTAMGRVEVDPGFPHDLVPYLTHHAEALLKEKKISKIPDWKVALRTEFMDKALKG